MSPTLDVGAPPPARPSVVDSQLAPIAESSAMGREVPVAAPATSPLPGRVLFQTANELPRRQSLIAETQSMLLSGLPDSTASTLLASIPRGRRQSAPIAELFLRRSSAHAAQRAHLLSCGHIYLGSAISADIFVEGVALRRLSIIGTAATAPTDCNSSSTTSADATSCGAGSTTTTNAAAVTGKKDSAPPTPLLQHGQQFIRARVRPKDIGRKPFLIHRVLDVETLRTTALDLADARPAFTRAPGRRPLLSARRRSAGGMAAVLELGRGAARPMSAMPIRKCTLPPNEPFFVAGPMANVWFLDLEYARSFLPVLAALLMSGHLRKGDVIDLPMPHPEVWPQTVAFVYTGQGELTDAMKVNVQYLGGKV
jgi:hypothetical protein